MALTNYQLALTEVMASDKNCIRSNDVLLYKSPQWRMPEGSESAVIYLS